MKTRLRILLLILLSTTHLRAVDDICASCQKTIYKYTVYIFKDRFTDTKVKVCAACEKLPECAICEVPAWPDLPGFVRLQDGRVLCARDAKTGVFDLDQATRVFDEMYDRIERMFFRFTTFPNRTKISLVMADRVTLQELLILAGNDYECPNYLGFTKQLTNGAVISHQISLMTGLPLAWLRSVCAHELSHAWVHEQVPDARRKTLGHDAEEGFCELMAYLCAVAQHDEFEKATILRNGYTAGQIDLFVVAEATYGINDVLDWMRYGTDEELSKSDPQRIRNVAAPERQPVPVASFSVFQAPPAAAPTFTNLVLKAVFWDTKRPLVLINDQSFGLNEEAKVRLGSSNVVVRCLAITPSSVRVRVDGSEMDEELKVKR